MQLTVEALKIQQKRIHRANRITQHADRVRAIGIDRLRSPLPTPVGMSGVERFIADRWHRDTHAARAFDLARRLYARAASVLRGCA